MALSSYLPRTRLLSLARVANRALSPSCESGQAAVMMIDLARFTRVSERLSVEGSLGAEKLSELLDTFYGEVSDAVSAAGGDVIAFAGDGIVSMWPVVGVDADAVCHAARCAESLVTRAFGVERLRARAAVSFGELRTYELGAESRWTSLFAGPCIAQLGSAAHVGDPGEVVLSVAAWQAAQQRVRVSHVSPEAFRLAGFGDEAPLSVGYRDPPLPKVGDQLLRRFLPPVVNVIHGDEPLGTAEWSAGFRNVSVVFVNLSDLDIDPIDALDTLQAAFEVIERLVQHHQGSTYQFLMDDNGISAVIAFGLPGAVLERRQGRALSAALAIKRRLEEVSIPSSIGVASGRLFCGVCGNANRRAYAMVGHTMNVAARLMQHAENDILCDEATAAGAEAQVRCRSLGRVAIKGLRERVEVLRPIAPVVPARRYQRLLGRDAERERVLARLATLGEGVHAPLVIEGEAGMGKSHLLADVQRSVSDWRLRVIVAEGDAVQRATPYYPWRAVLTELLGGAAPAGARRAALLAALEPTPELVPWAPVLDAVVRVGIPETEVTEQMSAAARADSLGAIMIQLLEHAARRDGVALVLDDVHWFDSVSLSLVMDVARRARGVLLVIGSRPDSPGSARLGELCRVPGAERMLLDALPRPLARRLVEDRLGVEELPEAIEAFIWERAEGHPLHTEELALALVGEQILIVENGSCRVSEERLLERAGIPEGLHGAITSRFDRVSRAAQLAIRTAAVIGRSFPRRMLAALVPGVEDENQLGDTISRLIGQGIFVESKQDLLSFRHVMMQDVVYDGLLHQQRRELHRRAAAWIEEEHRADPSSVLPLLAHHHERAGDARRATYYLERAAQQALATFSNREARGFLERAIALADDRRVPVGQHRRASWLEMLGVANLMLTEIDTAGELFLQSLELRHFDVPRSPVALASRLGAEAVRQLWHRVRGPSQRGADDRRMRVEANTYGHLSEIAYFQNRPLELVHNCLRSLNAAEIAGAAKEMAQGYAGTSIVLVLLGMLERSRAYRDRGVQLAHSELAPADTALALQLACVHALSVGDWEVAERLGTEAVEINRRLGDRFRMQTCLTTLGFGRLFTGDLARADETLESAIRSAGAGGAPQILLWGYGGRIAARLSGLGLERPLLAELEALLSRHAQTSSSEGILCNGLIALAYWRLGERSRATRRADLVLEMLDADLPVTYWLIWGISAVAEVFLADLERRGGRGGNALRKAQRICGVLRKYALMLPTARPAAFLMRGVLASRLRAGRRAVSLWKKAAAHGDALAMPVEAARARLFIANETLDDVGRRRAERELTRLGARW